MELSIGDPWFEFIKFGKKRYEGRKASDKLKELKKGDIIKLVHHTGLSLLVKIIDIHSFPTFEDGLKVLPLLKTLPSINTVDEGVEVYKKYVKLETQKTFGVLFFEIEVID